MNDADVLTMAGDGPTRDYPNPADFGFTVMDEPFTIQDAIQQAIGAASACWDNLEGAGVFESDRAKEIADQLLAYIKADQPWLGYATTGRLIEELAARAEVSAGEPWTQYRTVDSDD